MKAFTAILIAVAIATVAKADSPVIWSDTLIEENTTVYWNNQEFNVEEGTPLALGCSLKVAGTLIIDGTMPVWMVYANEGGPFTANFYIRDGGAVRAENTRFSGVLYEWDWPYPDWYANPTEWWIDAEYNAQLVLTDCVLDSGGRDDYWIRLQTSQEGLGGATCFLRTCHFRCRQYYPGSVIESHGPNCDFWGCYFKGSGDQGYGIHQWGHDYDSERAVAWCKFEDFSYGIHYSGRGLTVLNCEIDSCNDGAYITSESARFAHCYIHNNDHYGVDYTAGGTVPVYNSVIMNNNYADIHAITQGVTAKYNSVDVLSGVTAGDGLTYDDPNWRDGPPTSYPRYLYHDGNNSIINCGTPSSLEYDWIGEDPYGNRCDIGLISGRYAQNRPGEGSPVGDWGDEAYWIYWNDSEGTNLWFKDAPYRREVVSDFTFYGGKVDSGAYLRMNWDGSDALIFSSNQTASICSLNGTSGHPIDISRVESVFIHGDAKVHMTHVNADINGLYSVWTSDTVFWDNTTINAREAPVPVYVMGPSTLIIRNDCSISDGDLLCYGEVIVEGDSYVNGRIIVLNGGNLSVRNGGTLTCTDSLVIQGGGELEMTGGASVDVGTCLKFENQSVLSASGAGNTITCETIKNYKTDSDLVLNQSITCHLSDSFENWGRLVLNGCSVVYSSPAGLYTKSSCTTRLCGGASVNNASLVMASPGGVLDFDECTVGMSGNLITQNAATTLDDSAHVTVGGNVVVYLGTPSFAVDTAFLEVGGYLGLTYVQGTTSLNSGAVMVVDSVHKGYDGATFNLNTGSRLEVGSNFNISCVTTHQPEIYLKVDSVLTVGVTTTFNSDSLEIGTLSKTTANTLTFDQGTYLLVRNSINASAGTLEFQDCEATADTINVADDVYLSTNSGCSLVDSVFNIEGTMVAGNSDVEVQGKLSILPDGDLMVENDCESFVVKDINVGGGASAEVEYLACLTIEGSLTGAGNINVDGVLKLDGTAEGDTARISELFTGNLDIDGQYLPREIAKMELLGNCEILRSLTMVFGNYSEMHINQDARLWLGEGVEIAMNCEYCNFVADGSSGHRITIDGSNWSSIYLGMEFDSATLQYTDFFNADSGLILNSGHTSHVDNCTFKDMYVVNAGPADLFQCTFDGVDLVQTGGSLDIDFSTFENEAYFSLDSGGVDITTDITDCTFKDSYLWMKKPNKSLQTVSHCLFQDQDNGEPAAEFDDGSILVEECGFYSMQYPAIELVNCDGDVTKCLIDSCGWNTANEGSIQLSNSDPYLWCCGIKHVHGKGIWARNKSYFTLREPGQAPPPYRYKLGKNEIWGDVDPEGMAVKLMYLGDSSRVYCNEGCNWFAIDTSEKDCWFGWGDNTMATQDVRKNLWRDVVNDSDLTHNAALCSTYFHPKTKWTNWDIGVPGIGWASCVIGMPGRPGDDGGGDDIPEDGALVTGEVETLFEGGIYAMRNGDYETAFANFREIIYNYPEHELASIALKRLYWAAREYDLHRLEEADEGEEISLETSAVLGELQTLRDSNGPLAMMARSYVPIAKVSMADYSAALEDYQGIINNPISEAEEIYARVDSQRVAFYITDPPMAAVGQDRRIAEAHAAVQRFRAMREMRRQQSQMLAQLAPDEKPPITEEIPEEGLALPDKFELQQCYPNPFNPMTVIKFALPKDVQVRLDVFNIVGQKVVTLVDKPMEAGWHSVSFDGSSLASGVYIYRIEASSFVDSKKMVLIR